ncbi:DUF5131 family protein [Roseiconus lacunae]|uniref:DUF5131 family protein n=1 Tax=Roseiconus lacunae TaxID=2605694 RepID=UPI0036F39F0B
MAESTRIQWCDSTVSPVQDCGGCQLWNVSARTFYSKELAEENERADTGFPGPFDRPALRSGRMKEAATWPDLSHADRNRPSSPDSAISHDAKPWLSGLPRHILISSTVDLLIEKGSSASNLDTISDETLFPFLKEEIIDVVQSELGSNHQWLWLTSNPQRLHEFAEYAIGQESWPANLWVGTSVSCNAHLSRVDALCKFRGREVTKFVKAEPLLQEVSLSKYLKKLHWVIVGGDWSRNRRSNSFDCIWAETLIQECAQSSVPIFVEQLGSNAMHNGKTLKVSNIRGDDARERPKSVRVRQMPVSRARFPQSKS